MDRKVLCNAAPPGWGLGMAVEWIHTVEARHSPNHPAAGQATGQGASKMHQEEVRVEGTPGSSFSERMDENRVSLGRTVRLGAVDKNIVKNYREKYS